MMFVFEFAIEFVAVEGVIGTTLRRIRRNGRQYVGCRSEHPVAGTIVSVSHRRRERRNRA